MKKKSILQIMVFMFALSLVTIFGGCENDEELTGINLESRQYIYDGTEKELLVSGDTDDCIVVYRNNRATNAGNYEATAIVKKSGYKPLTLTANLNILKSDNTIFYTTKKELLLGESLGEIECEKGQIVWDNDAQKLSLGNNNVKWKYAPTDTTNYKSSSGFVSVNVLSPVAMPNVYETMQANISYFQNSVYNDFGSNNTYKINETINGNIIDFYDYYIPLFDNIYGETKLLSLDDITYKVDDTVSLSIGNNSFVVDKAYQIVDFKLYVAMPIVMDIIDDGITLKICDEEFTNDTTLSSTKLSVSSVAMSSDSSQIVKEDDTYKVTLGSGTDLMYIYLSSVTNDSVALTKKTFTYSDDSVKYSYGFTKMEQVTNYPLGIYLKWGATATDNEDDFSLLYDIYVVGLGKVSINIQVDISILV